MYGSRMHWLHVRPILTQGKSGQDVSCETWDTEIETLTFSQMWGSTPGGALPSIVLDTQHLKVDTLSDLTETLFMMWASTPGGALPSIELDTPQGRDP